MSAAAAAVDEADAKVGAALATSEGWSKLKAKIAAVTSAKPADPQKAFDTYNEVTAATLTLIVDIGNNSNLILDPDLDSYYLMDSVVNKVPSLIDTADHGDRCAAEALFGALYSELPIA